jgi:hypothetical protein
MQNEHMQFNFQPGSEKAEIIIREVKEVNELKIKEPLRLAISGTLGAPTEFLTRRMDQPDQVNQKRCHIVVDREEILIVLVTNENDGYLSSRIAGKLEFHPKFIAFGINTGKDWTPTQLGLFFKMNRAFFISVDDNMRLVTLLMNFTASVNNSIERSVRENGDRSDKFEQLVNSNLPKSFNLRIPIFKGMPAEIIEVETFAKVNGREVSFVLLSPGAQATQEDIRDKAIDGELNAIRSICPDIAIIEQ